MTNIVQPLTAEVTIVTSFQDADPMGVIYHGNYFRYFEEVRHALMDKIGYSYQEMQDSGYLWPIIDTRVKYVKPLPFNHAIRITAAMTEWENRLRVDYVIFDKETGQRLTKAHTKQVAVHIDNGEMCYVSPTVFTDKVEAYHAGTTA